MTDKKEYKGWAVVYEEHGRFLGLEAYPAKVIAKEWQEVNGGELKKVKIIIEE